MAEKSHPLFVTLVEIAQETGISSRTLWRWIAAGKFPPPDLAVERVRRWRRDTIENWIQQNHARPGWHFPRSARP